MSMLNQRLQVLLDEERMKRLELVARERGASVGHLVREALDLAFPSVPAQRRGAAGRLLDRSALNLGDDWGRLKAEMLDLDQE